MTLWDKKWRRIPEEWRRRYLATREPHQVRGDLVEAFDRIESLKLKVWILGGVVAAEGAVIGWLATSLLHCIETAQKVVVH